MPQDLRIIETSGLDAFDYDSIKRYRIRMSNLRPNHVWESLENTDFLQRIGAIGRGGDQKFYPTAAGLLMFGFEHEIIREFPDYFLDYQERYDNSTRWTDRVTSNAGDWSGNIHDFYFLVYNKIQQNIKLPFALKNGGDRIDDSPVHEALREALTNALIHADYHDRRGIVIVKEKQIITFSNPGNMRIGIEEAMYGGVSDPRNTALIKMFSFIGAGERAGSGLPNIISVWKKQKWAGPKIREEFNPDRTILSLEIETLDAPKKQAIKTSDKKQAIKTSDKKQAIKTSDKNARIAEAQEKMIADFLADNHYIKSAQAEELLRISPARARAILAELVKKGILTAEGGNRNRMYRLK
jgi:predicted HTH transcriptional regulator